jgi:hypothetical protein
MLCFFIILYVFFATKSENRREEQVLLGSWSAGDWGEEVAQTMYTHVSKCNKDKIKKLQLDTHSKLPSTYECQHEGKIISKFMCALRSFKSSKSNQNAIDLYKEQKKY